MLPAKEKVWIREMKVQIQNFLLSLRGTDDIIQYCYFLYQKFVKQKFDSLCRKINIF